MSDTKLVRSRVATCGMLPGQVASKPAALAEMLVDNGYAVYAESLSDRSASERPVRHPSNVTGGTLGAERPNPIPPTPRAVTPAPLDDGSRKDAPPRTTLRGPGTPAVGKRDED